MIHKSSALLQQVGLNEINKTANLDKPATSVINAKGPTLVWVESLIQLVILTQAKARRCALMLWTAISTIAYLAIILHLPDLMFTNLWKKNAQEGHNNHYTSQLFKHRLLITKASQLNRKKKVMSTSLSTIKTILKNFLI